MTTNQFLSWYITTVRLWLDALPWYFWGLLAVLEVYVWAKVIRHFTRRRHA